ncbi:MAG: hypothetical protein H6733_04545 [Alphaproteobacteria bacterium]|nr:hypothetical protein [Alphaproteobacteria bacterium]
MTPDAARDEATVWGIFARPGAWAVLTAVLVVVAFVAEQVTWPLLNHDVAAILHVAQRELHGEVLYTDLRQPNPPLIFLVSEGVVVVGEALGLGAVRAMALFQTTLVLGLWALASWVLRRSALLSLPGWRVAVWAMLTVLLPFAGYELGQREQLLFALVLPYLIGAAARVAGRPLGWGPGLLVGVLAGAGLALKPYFPPLFVLTELWVLAHTRRPRDAVRGETVGVVAFVAVFGAYVVWGTDYVDNLSFWLSGYKRYGALGMSFAGIVGELKPPQLLLTAIVWILARPRTPERGPRLLGDVLALATLPLLLSVFAQAKGFAYHIWPVHAAAVLLVVVSLIGAAGAGSIWRYGPLVAGTLSAVYLLAAEPQRRAVRDERAYWPGGYECTPRVVRPGVRAADTCALSDLVAYVGSLTEPGDAIAWVSPSVVPGAYVQTELLVRDVVRVSPLLLPDLYPPEARDHDPFVFHTAADRPPVEQAILDGLRDDVIREAPALIVVDDRQPLLGFGAAHVDLVAFYRQEPQLAALLDERYVEVPDAASGGAHRFFVRSDRAP